MDTCVANGYGWLAAVASPRVNSLSICVVVKNKPSPC